MRLFNNHSYTNRLPMKGKVKKGFRTYCAVVMSVMLIVSCFTVMAFAADSNGALTAVNNLSTFIFSYPCDWSYSDRLRRCADWSFAQITRSVTES